MQKLLRGTACKMILLFLYGCCCLGSMAAQAQTAKLRYEPQSPVVQLRLDDSDVTFLTDTSALFALYPLQGRTVDRDYNARVHNLIHRQLAESTSDTTFFKGSFVPFNDGLEGRFSQNGWSGEWTVLTLLKSNQVKILDQRGKVVKRLRIKLLVSHDGCLKELSYRNKANNRELFREFVSVKTITPAF